MTGIFDTGYKRPRRNWLGALSAGLLLAGATFGASAATVTAGLGAVSSGTLYTFAYVVASDGGVYRDTVFGGGNQGWAGLATPSGVAIEQAAGVVYPGGREELYIVGSDGNLWTYQPNGWADLGHPGSGVSISSTVGTILNGSGYPYIFVIGSDGNLWLCNWNGSGWPWNNLGKPSSTITASKGIGVFESGAGDPEAYVVGGDGNVWINQWNGSGWPWTNLSKPSTASLPTPVGVADAGGNPQIYMVGSDGNLWTKQWNGSYWNAWSSLSKPSSTVSISTPIGSIDGINFVLGSDGNLWIDYWSGSAWLWSNAGKPSGTTLSKAVGTTYGGYPYAFISGANGDLYYIYYNSSTWTWVDAGAP